MSYTWQPERIDLLTSVARSERNETGVAWYDELLPRQMELLKEIVPHLRRVAYIYGATPLFPPEAINARREYATITASTLGFRWQYFAATVASGYDEIFARITAEHFDAAFIDAAVPMAVEDMKRISELALHHGIPAVSEAADLAKGGILLSYGQDIDWGLARGAEYVDNLLRGARPSDLRVEQGQAVGFEVMKPLGIT